MWGLKEVNTEGEQRESTLNIFVKAIRDYYFYLLKYYIK